MMSGLHDHRDHTPYQPIGAGRPFPRSPGACAGETGDASDGQQLGATIRLLRRRAGLSQSALAARFGLTYQQWQKYETGQNRVSAVTLHALAQLLGIDIRHFFPTFDSLAPLALDDTDSSVRTHDLARLMAALPDTDQNAVLALAAHLAGRADARGRGAC